MASKIVRDDEDELESDSDGDLTLNSLDDLRCQSHCAQTAFFPLTLGQAIPSYYHHTQFHTRQHHPNHFILPQATLNTYKYSFYPRTIKDWNNLPINMIEARDLNEFTYLLNLNYCNHQFIYVCDCTIWGFLPPGHTSCMC